MKPTEKIAKAAPFVAGIVAIAAAALLVILILLAELGAIFPRRLTLGLVSEDKVKTYDGTPLMGELDVSYGALADGHTIEILAQTSIVAVGEAENEIEFRILDRTGADVTERYDISLKTGTLTVTPAAITVRSNSERKPYDGKPLSDEGFAYTSGKLFDDHSLVVTGSTTLESVGKVPNRMSFAVVDGAGNDVTYLYDIKVIEGTLEITGLPLRIKTGSASKVYDGSPLENVDYQIASGTLVAGHTMSRVGATSFDGVGTVDNVIRFVIKDASGKDVTALYQITYAYGTLSVTPRPLTIKTGSITRKYTGSAVYTDTYEIISGSLCAGHTLKIVGKRRTEVGYSYNDVVSYTITVESDGKTVDVSHCYKLSYDSGTIQVLAP